MPTPMKVFERLNALSHLTPDEIARKIAPVTWVKGPSMTKAIMEDWGLGHIRICYETTGGDFSLTSDNGYSINSFTLSSLHGSLGRYWFILEENFDGRFPDRAS